MPLIMGLTRMTEANGPGKRGLIHFQGCSLGCVGCFNPQSHTFNQKQEMDLDIIQKWILSLKDVEGITFSGGEPIQQAPYLYALVTFIKEHRPELTIGMYTGYSTKELESGNFKWKSAYDAEWVRGSKQLWQEIKKHLDFAITGRYNQQMACHDEPLRGSRNQEVCFYTSKYKQEDLPQQIAEVNVGEDGLIQVTGYPTEGFLNEIAKQPDPPAKPMSRNPVPCIKDDEDGDLACV